MIKRRLLAGAWLHSLTEAQAVTDREGDTAAPAAKPSHLFKQQQTWDISSPSYPYWRRGKNHVLRIMHFSHPRWRDSCPYVVISTTPKVHSLNLACSPLAWQVLLQTLLIYVTAGCLLPWGSSGSIWAPWSLISMFCNASWISTFSAVSSVSYTLSPALALLSIRIR